MLVNSGKMAGRVALVIAMAVVLMSSTSQSVATDNNNIAMVTEESVASASDALKQMIGGIITHSHIEELLGKGAQAAEFAGFAFKHGKVYKSVEELTHRFNTFVSNVERIEEHNKKGLSYTLGVNKFADFTFEDFKQSHLGAGQECSATRGGHVMKSKALPLQLDWRVQKIVSPVKDQGHCGSCWTFSTTGALESAHAQATGRMVLLSEQQLVDCAGDFNNYGCNGGLPSQAFEYIKYNGGVDTESSYTYRGVDLECKFNPSNVGARVSEVVNITEGAEDELKDAIAFGRPVSVAFEVVSDFYLYDSGVYTSTNCQDKKETVNHAVLAVGYDLSKSVNALPYYIIKNSWGGDWGENGYFKMEMDRNMCGVAVCAAYPIVPEDFLR